MEKINVNGSRINKPSKIMLIPIAQMTWRMITLYNGLKVHPSVIIKISTSTNQNPLLMRKELNSDLVFFLLIRYAAVPARKTIIGAQKWVIQRVKNRAGVVVARFVGSKATDAPPA